MLRHLSKSLLVATILAVVALPAVAATRSSQPVVHRDGKAFTVAVCGDLEVEGYARCHAHAVTDGTGAILATTSSTSPAGLHPADLRAAYNISAVGSSATTVAIVDAWGYNNAEQDLAVYRSTFGLPPCTTANGCFQKLNQNGFARSYPPQDEGWAQETATDLAMVSAMCPNCKIILIEANNPASVNLAAAVATAHRLGANVIANSYGGFEGNSTTLEPSYNVPGVAVLASTGDSGYGVQFPASSPHVIAVGGTTLTRNANVARGWSETAWVGGGSGCSTVYPKPAWQTDSLCAKRMEADVSIVGDPNTGVSVYGPINQGFRSGWIVIGGTSVSVQVIAGIYGGQGGSANYASNIYAAWGANHAVLNDVTAGSNGSCGGTYFCTSQVGYDGPTGLGTPNGSSPF